MTCTAVLFGRSRVLISRVKINIGVERIDKALSFHLGDGIHNFADGLAIGAAFASSITGGISTSIAVFCHELPHEIGDFAVLLRAGMTVKQAVVFNCLSSILCLLGMLIGVAIGNISSASLWVFSAIAGIFLYVALVDMLPEMSSVDPKKGENPFLHLLLQVLGILLGSGIMLLIAVFERDIKSLILFLFFLEFFENIMSASPHVYSIEL
ncbi:hypothetical protein Btru_009057 [Bulinus truncatus]|nr:hypothetical protein Btru_009057 [Bulinus truncatus]